MDVNAIVGRPALSASRHYANPVPIQPEISGPSIGHAVRTRCGGAPDDNRLESKPKAFQFDEAVVKPVMFALA